jgi:hypothetical protein
MKHWRTICIGLMLAATAARTGHADVGVPILTDRYKYRVPISFPGYSGSAAVSNFPALIILNTSIDGFNYAHFKNNAEDLRFGDDADNDKELAYEIEKWDPSGSSFVWVRIPELSATTTISGFWGNPSESQPAYTTNGAAWESAFEGVWHMTETNALDSTSNGHQGTSSGNTITSATAGDAQNFDGSAHINVSSVSDRLPSTGLTLHMLARTVVASGAEGQGGTMLAYSRAGYTPQLQLNISGGEPTVIVGSGFSAQKTQSGVGIDDGNWHQFVYVHNNGTGSLYVDGNYQVSHSKAVAFADTGGWAIGATLSGSSTSRHHVGGLDEVRASSGIRSADWIKACYQTSLSNPTFTTYGEVSIKPEAGSVFFGW